MTLDDGRVATARARDVPPDPAIADPALPRLAELLDPDAMRPVLSGRCGRARSSAGSRSAASSTSRASSSAVHYRAGPGDAVLTSIARIDLAARARAPRYAGPRARVDGRSPAPAPLTYDAGRDALVTWLPYDPRLPALAEPPEELSRRLRARRRGASRRKSRR